MSKKITKEDLIKAYIAFEGKGDKDNMQRYSQWNIFRDIVEKNINAEKVNIDEVSVNLAMYLASCGMYRGSSVLLKYFSHKVHDGLVEKVLVDKYNELFNIKTLDVLEDKLYLIGELYETIANHYMVEFNKRGDLKYNNKPLNKQYSKYELKDISSTLLTKVMIGFFGCTIAFDRYAKDTLNIIKKQTDLKNKLVLNIRDKKSLIKSMQSIIEIMKELNYTESKKYPIMKELDMALFQYGIKTKEINKLKGLFY